MFIKGIRTKLRNWVKIKELNLERFPESISIGSVYVYSADLRQLNQLTKFW